MVITKGLATLRELKYEYNLEELFMLYEVAAVNGYNEWLAVKK